MTLEDILKTKGSTVFTIHPEATVDDAVGDMVRHNVGALVVCRRDLSEGELVEGIITERDVLRLVAAGTVLKETRVADVMTTEIIAATPDMTVEQAMGIMTDRRVRHLPVISEKRLVGIVSIGDLVKAERDLLARENRFMKDYMQS